MIDTSSKWKLQNPIDTKFILDIKEMLDENKKQTSGSRISALSHQCGYRFVLYYSNLSNSKGLRINEEVSELINEEDGKI